MANNYNRIPVELRQLKQWVVADQNKVPLDPKTGRHADVTDCTTWGTFEQAVESANGHHHGIGFVFSEDNPYTFIDLDAPEDAQQQARHTSIYNHFQSYTETSRSGKGVHIIVRGKVPTGARRDKVEVYPHGRYAIMTGNVLKDLPITDQQTLLDELFKGMKPAAPESDLVQVDSIVEDSELLSMASNAVNSEKFNQLCAGQWREMNYPSQSEADFALLSILAFYSADNEQVRRLFRMSALGKRTKAQKNDQYIDRCLRKIRANEPPPVDITAFAADKGKAPDTAVQGSTGETNTRVQTERAPEPLIAAAAAITPPPGLMGEIANYIYSSAVKPVPEVAVAGAIAFLAGICGRAYNISSTGLNQYVILLGETGIGKEASSTGIDKLFTEVRKTVPSVDTFVGPGTFASGQAMLKVLDKKPCFVAVIGEFGHTLHRMSAPDASSADSTSRQVLLDLYMKSGHGRMLREMAYSDKEKNTIPVASPALTLLGESTPSKFYGGLNTNIIEEGLVPRFLVISTDVKRVERNENAGAPPPAELVQKVQDLCYTSLTTQQNQRVCYVTTNDAARLRLKDFENHCDEQGATSERGCDKELWSRAYLKTVRLAGLVAVGSDWHRPVVDVTSAEWAINLVIRGTEDMLARLGRGEYGEGEVQFDAELKKALTRWYEYKPAQRATGKGSQDVIMHDNIVPFAFIRDQLRRRACFINARMGLHRAIETAIQDAIHAGVLLELPPAQRVQLGVKCRSWALGRW